MFCDLVGSTDLSQRLDAEDLRSVVRAYQEAASQAIERYEGQIAQYLGDGLLVYLSYPLAHEDDAERAVRAGLEILTALRTLNDALEPKHGTRLAARVGIHTGPVVIAAMGGGAKSDVLALGDTTNIAARLEAVAAPDSSMREFYAGSPLGCGEDSTSGQLVELGDRQRSRSSPCHRTAVGIVVLFCRARNRGGWDDSSRCDRRLADRGSARDRSRAAHGHRLRRHQ